MPDIQWDSEASLMRVTEFATADAQEELVARGTLLELVGQVLDMPPAQQRDLLLRAAGPEWTQEYDTDAIRELAARPEFTAAHGEYDTADLPDDSDRATMDQGLPVIDNDTSAPAETDALGRDGEK